MTRSSDDFDRIPLVDIGAALGPPVAAGPGSNRSAGTGESAAHASTARRALSEELHTTLREVGFAYVVNHGVPLSLLDELKREAGTFFDRPIEEKQAIAINRWHRGYMAFNSSTIVTSSVARVEKPNQSESFLALHEVASDAESAARDSVAAPQRPLDGPNQWPVGQPALRASALAYMASMETLARRLVPLIAEGMGLPSGIFADSFSSPTVFLRLLHYPPQAPEEGLFGSAPHTDYGFLTLLAQDDVGGLEVRNKAGDWIPAPPVPGSFVLNVGDILSRWSGGRLASTPHRVRNLSGRERYSFPFFFDPDVDTVVTSLAPFTPGAAAIHHQRPGFEPVRYGDYLMERLDRNHSYRKQAGEPATW